MTTRQNTGAYPNDCFTVVSDHLHCRPPGGGYPGGYLSSGMGGGVPVSPCGGDRVKVRVVLEVELNERVLALVVTANQKKAYLTAANGAKLEDWITDTLDYESNATHRNIPPPGADT
jgi:hypothetical protein